MLYLLGFLCAALVVWNGILLIKIAGMRRAADEICAEVDSRLGRDTNPFHRSMSWDMRTR